MSAVVGIKESNTNQISYVFTDCEYKIGEMLVIENGKGEYIYECVRSSEQYKRLSHKIVETKSVRAATSDELLKYLKLQKTTEPFKQIFKQMTKELKVNADLINIDLSLDGENLRYTYFSLEKLHFPKLIKYLLMNNPSRKKIEFYQVGEREYYATHGGIGVCGYELCCHSRMHHTPTITTNSLSELGINIALKKSLTGTCSKYKCCLLFTPSEKLVLKETLPDLDQEIEYLQETVVVTAIDLEKKIVTVVGQEVIEIDFDYFTQKGTNVSNK